MTLFTLGHGTLDEATFVARLSAAAVRQVADVRRFPGSRRWPWFTAMSMARWLPDAGIAYVPAVELGGRRAPSPASRNVALREPGFRGYADYMETADFRTAFDVLLREAAALPTAIVCSETLWWRCHRRLIADAAVLLARIDVVHLVGTARRPHRLTDGVRRDGARLVYDGASG